MVISLYIEKPYGKTQNPSIIKPLTGTCLVVQRLRLCPFTAGGTDQTSWGTKIRHALQYGQKVKQQQQQQNTKQNRNKREFLSLTKSIYKNLRVNIILNVDQKDFSLKSGIRQGYSFLPLLFKIVLIVPVTAIKQEKEIKGSQIKRDYMPLCVDDMILDR